MDRRNVATFTERSRNVVGVTLRKERYKNVTDATLLWKRSCDVTNETLDKVIEKTLRQRLLCNVTCVTLLGCYIGNAAIGTFL